MPSNFMPPGQAPGHQLPDPRRAQPNTAPQGYGQNSPFTDGPQRANPNPGAPRGGSASRLNPASGGDRFHFPSSYTPIPAVKRPFQTFFNPFANPLSGGGLANGFTNSLQNANFDKIGQGTADIATLIMQALSGGR